MIFSAPLSLALPPVGKLTMEVVGVSLLADVAQRSRVTNGGAGLALRRCLFTFYGEEES